MFQLILGYDVIGVLICTISEDEHGKPDLDTSSCICCIIKTLKNHFHC